MAVIKLYSTSIFSTLKTRSDVTRLRNLLRSKAPLDGERPVIHFLTEGILDYIPDSCVEFEEIDLSEEPNRGEEMVKLSGGVKTLPQLHVDTRVFLDYNEIQEMEDFGELDLVLSGQAE